MPIQSNLRMTVSVTSSYYLQMTVSAPLPVGNPHTHTEHVLPGSSLASKLITMHHAFSGNMFKNHVK